MKRDFRHPENDPAFPVSRDPFNWAGVTKRELAAMFAMQGILANANRDAVDEFVDQTAHFAVRQADALLSKLNDVDDEAQA